MQNKKDKSEQFLQKYDRLVRVYEDPVKVLFEIMANVSDQGLRFSAAKELVSYRFPKQKAIDINASGLDSSHITFIMGPATIDNKTLVLSAKDEFSRLPLNASTLIEQRAFIPNDQQ